MSDFKNLQSLDPVELFGDDTALLEVLRTLFASYTSRAYVVGGAVRDFLLGRKIVEYDIEVYDITWECFETLMQAWGAKGVGEAFFVYRKGRVDCSLPRCETKSGKGHTGFDVTITQDLGQAGRRRDFTVNAMMVNIFTGEMVDIFGGQADISRKILRCIDPVTFVEDPLRVFRAMQLGARLDFCVEPLTQALCREVDISDVTKERITAEFEKLDHRALPQSGALFFSLGLAHRLYGLDPKDECAFVSRLICVVPHKKIKPLILFLATLKEIYHLSFATLAQPFVLSRHDQRFLHDQYRIPKSLTPRFLAALAVKRPLSEWHGQDRIQKGCLIDPSLWERQLSHHYTGHDALARGLVGREIGIFLRQCLRTQLLAFKGRQ